MYRRTVGMLWPSKEILIKKNQTELRIKFANQSQLVFKSGDKPDNLRTETLHFAAIDEVRDQSPDLWPMVIRPMLATTQGRAIFMSTANGFDTLYDMTDNALRNPQLWEVFKAPSTCNPTFTEDELQLAKQEMTDAQFRQEIMAEFVELYAGKVYVSYGPHNVTDEHPWAKGAALSPHLPIVVAMDFNLSPMSWTLGQYRTEEFYWHDEIHLEHSHTQEAAHELAARVKGHEPGVILAGDATSKAGQRAAAGQSDYDIVCQILDMNKIRWTNATPDVNPTVKDRVNYMNAKMRAADGKVHFWHHPRCKALKRDLERVTWKDGATSTLDPGPKRELTHASDGVGYAVSALAPLQSRFQVGGLRVIVR